LADASIGQGIQFDIFKALDHGLEGFGGNAVESRFVAIQNRDRLHLASGHRAHRVAFKFGNAGGRFRQDLVPW
jgi:hypothetical protein